MPWQQLRRLGVLGINERNSRFTLSENPRRLYPLVDTTLLTKELCERAGIPTAPVLARAERHGDVKQLISDLSGTGDFVLKPAMGAMGNGILVIHDSTESGWTASGKRVISREQLAYHAESIISGLYALGGRPDIAFAEERLRLHPDLVRISHDGVPDIRIIVFRGVPVMAMTRLPTKASAGRANLHQGAVGAGIDLTTGRTNFAVIRTTPVDRHPDTHEAVVDFQIPQFAPALRAAIQASDETGLGYVGADIVIDSRYGAVVLELNARPGLAIQVANRAGLLPRLNAIRARDTRELDLDARIALGLELAESC